MKTTMDQARDVIFTQEDVSLGVKKSAWFLFLHELGKVNPRTGSPYTEPQVLESVLKWIAGQMARVKTAHLTPTERRIVKLLVEGLTMKEVAQEMQVSFRVVKRHMQNVRTKTGMVSTYQVIALAVDRGWVRAPRINE